MHKEKEMLQENAVQGEATTLVKRCPMLTSIPCMLTYVES